MSPQIYGLLASVPEEALFRLDIHTAISFAIQFVSVVVLFIVLKKLLHQPITDFLKKREERVAGELQFAEEEMSKGTAFKQEYELKVKEISREREEILDAARKLASDIAKESEIAAKAEADNIRARAAKDIELEQERAKAEVKQAIIECSAVMVSKFLTAAIDEETQERLFNETMAELEDVAWHN